MFQFLIIYISSGIFLAHTSKISSKYSPFGLMSTKHNVKSMVHLINWFESQLTQNISFVIFLINSLFIQSRFSHYIVLKIERNIVKIFRIVAIYAKIGQVCCLHWYLYFKAKSCFTSVIKEVVFAKEYIDSSQEIELKLTVFLYLKLSLRLTLTNLFHVMPQFFFIVTFKCIK